MSTRPVITVVGSFAVGMTIQAVRFPLKGETLLGRNFNMGPGGKGSNQAVGAARLGAESHLVARIGTDLLGDMAIELYEHEAVDACFVSRTDNHPTGAGIITLNAEGDNHIVIDMGANAALTPTDVDAAEGLLSRSDVVMSVLEIPVETAARAMELARKHGRLSVLNPAPAQPVPISLLHLVDVVTLNEGELRALVGSGPGDRGPVSELAQELQARGPQSVVVTRGDRGALVVETNGKVSEVSAVRVDAVDTTGAGDAFACALAVALAEHHVLVEAVQFAVCAGALACTQLGAVPALPTRSEVDSLMPTVQATQSVRTAHAAHRRAPYMA